MIEIIIGLTVGAGLYLMAGSGKNSGFDKTMYDSKFEYYRDKGKK